MKDLHRILLHNLMIICLICGTTSTFAKSGIGLGVASEYAYDNNIKRVNTNKEEALILLAKPTVGLQLDIGKFSLTAAGHGVFAYDQLGSGDDYEDLAATGALAWKANRYHGMTIEYLYSDAHIPRGTLEAFLPPTAPLEYEFTQIGSGKLSFPIYKDSYDLHLGGGYAEKRYFGAITTSRNRNQVFVEPELRYRYSGKTSAVFGYRINDVKMLDQAPVTNLNLFSQSGYIGARWLATGKSQSHALIGYEFAHAYNDANGRDDNSGKFKIDVAAQWRRKSFSTVVLKLKRESQSSELFGVGYLVKSDITGNWIHKLTNHWGLDAGSTLYMLEALDKPRKLGGEFFVREIGGEFSVRTGYDRTWIGFGIRTSFYYRLGITDLLSWKFDPTRHFTAYKIALEARLSI
ncbi:MAG: hypothetical protein OEZ43_09935 [Gammaproteobacteria bacterium]|nr:hypothetical protein [Gammaproteobacteria bacterium]